MLLPKCGVYESSFSCVRQPKKSNWYSQLHLNQLQFWKFIIYIVSIFLKSKTMELIKRIEETIFSKIINLQKIRIESGAAFVFVSLIKFLFKDAFVLIMFLLHIDTITSISTGIATNIITNSIIVTITLLVFVVILYILYGEGGNWSQSVLDFNRMFLPYVDAISFPIVVFALAITSNSNSILVFGQIITVMGISFFSLCYNLFNFSKLPKTRNIFQFKQAKTVMLSYVLELIFCYYLAIPWSKGVIFNYQQLIVYCFIKFILSFMKFKQKIIHKFYINSFAQKASSFFYFMELNLAFIALSMSILEIDLIGSNIIYILIIMTILASIAFIVYIQWRDNELFLSQAKDIKEEDEALIYLDCLAELSRKIQNQEQDIILISLKTKHQLTCLQTNCFCKVPSKNLKNFIQSYIKRQLQIMTKSFHNQMSVLLSVLYFKMVLFKFYPEILSKLAEYETKFNFSMIQRFYRHSLTNYVQNYIKQKNAQIDAVESQQMFRLEEVTTELEKLIKNQVEMRQKKWKYLSKGLCQVGELQFLCGNQLNSIKRVMQIFYQNRFKFKKSKQFNLLMLFYFTKISFLNNGKDIKQNLKEIFYGYKVDELNSIKQFKKFIYHKRCCSIETYIDPKVMGIITAASHNVEQMFGFPYQKVIGSSINSLMPEFMAGSHENIMSNWAKTGTWRTIGKLKQIYCIYKQQYCFSALLYLKIYVKETGLHFITNIFKLNDTDYLIVNSQGKIEGLGKKFIKVLGESAKKMPLDLLIETKTKIPHKQDFDQDKVYRRVFISLKNCEKQVQNYMQSLNARNYGKNEIKENFYYKLCEICHQKYFIQFTAKNYRMGNISFWILQMIESRLIQQSKTNYYLENTSNYIGSLREHIGNELDFDVSERKSDSSQVDEAENFFQNNCSSITSISQKQNYPLSKVIQKFLEFLQNPHKIKDQRIQHVTCGIIIMVILLTVINFVTYFLYWAALNEIQNIFFADGAVSDIMQTTEITYDHIFNLRAQLIAKNYTSFDSEYKSALYLHSYVYGLRQYSFANLITAKTNLKKKRIYQYIQTPARWQMVNITLEIQTHQFLQNLHYLTKELLQDLSKMRLKNSSNVTDPNQFKSNYLQMLVDNFPQLQSLNQYYLQMYQSSSNESHRILGMSSIASLILHLIVTLIAAILVDQYYRFRFNQVQNCFKFFGFIPHSFLQKLREYYSQISLTVIQEEQLKDIDNHEDKVFAIDTQELFGKSQPSGITLNSKLKIINYSNYYRWIFILLVFLGLNGLNYNGTQNVRNFFGPSKSVIQLIGQLMRSQNRLLQTYFDLKAKYYLNPTVQYTNQYFVDLRIHLNTTVSVFSVIAKKITTVLSVYDPDFQNKFIESFITSVCILSSPSLPQSQNKKCLNELLLKMLDGGLMIAMNYFQVSVESALQQMKAQYLLKSRPFYNGNYFQTQTYAQLDKMFIYMFRLYQLTQGICYESYANAIILLSDKFLKYMISFTLFYLTLMILWLLCINYQKQKLSWLYGQLILVPFSILKSNNRIVLSLKEATQYHD